jgi:hypothetical protein
VKNQSLDFAHLRQAKLKPRYEKVVPQFQTEFVISNGYDIQKSTPNIQSTKKIFTSFDNNFIPYLKQKTES